MEKVMTRIQQPGSVVIILVLLLGQSVPATRTDRNFVGRNYMESHHHHHHDTPGHGHQSSPSYGHGWTSHGHTSGHGHSGFQSFFDIALTGLAFLSFGIFLLNLLLNALAGAGTATGTLLPPTNTGTGIITTTATATARSRSKRQIPFNLHLDPLTSMDALAASVLKSIDAMVEKHDCLPKFLCDGNKEASVIGSGFQYLMPACSLGLSYIGRKIGFHEMFPEHMNAVFLGLHESNCRSHFPQC